MNNIQQKSAMADLMIWFVIFGIQAAVAMLTYGQYPTGLLMA
ncbi:MAG: hypothetical protein WCA63_02515 [Gallionella sp.]